MPIQKRAKPKSARATRMTMIRFTPEEHAALAQDAREDARTVSQYIRLAVKERIARRAKLKPPRSPLLDDLKTEVPAQAAS